MAASAGTSSAASSGASVEDQPMEKSRALLGRVSEFFQTYFCAGQLLSDKHAAKLATLDSVPWYERYRRPLSMAFPALLFHIIWWSVMLTGDHFHHFADKYWLSITMVFGSMIAGATSEGGASVAFPVMTLAFGIKPAIARDFSFMIQSVGMTAAAFSIYYMKVKVEQNSILFCSIGGIIGMIFGLEVVAPALPPAYSKMYFVSIWFSFATSLYWLNRIHGRPTFEAIPHGQRPARRAILVAFGFVGGIFSSIAGSGIDICSFSCLTLLFRVSEKVATPTSVVLMAGNTVVGFLWRNFAQGGVESDAWGFFLVCMPIVVIGAPLGSVIGSHFHRLVLAAFVYVTDTVQFVGAWVIVKAAHKDASLALSSWAFVFSGALFFTKLTKQGGVLLEERLGELQLQKDVDCDPDAPASVELGDVELVEDDGVAGAAAASPDEQV